MRTLIKNAEVVSPEGVLRAAVLIEGTKIVDIDPAPQVRADEVIDATGLHLLPGVIDDQVHFREPGLTHKEDLFTGSRACAKGGVTTFLEMPNTDPATVTCERLAQKLELAAGKSLVNYGFYIGATPHNVAELQQAQRTPGIKIFIGSSTGDLLVDQQEALERIFAETTLPICAHCEDEATIALNKAKFAPASEVENHSKIRDERAAVVATMRAVKLAQKYRHRFHVLHVSTGLEIAEIASHCLLPRLQRAGKTLAEYVREETSSQGIPLAEFRISNAASLLKEELPQLTMEVCPHHLFFNTMDYARLGTWVQMNPSVKSEKDNQQLWQALLDGWIQVIATDHAPHTIEEKQKPYPQSPSGLPAVENSLALMLNQVNQGRCTIEQVVQWMCDAPARVWDIVDKGRVAVGYDADLVLVDLAKRAVVRNEEQITKCKWSPWHGEELQGWPVRTWVRGRQVFYEGKFDEDCRGSEAQFDHARGGYWATA